MNTAVSPSGTILKSADYKHLWTKERWKQQIKRDQTVLGFSEWKDKIQSEVAANPPSPRGRPRKPR